MAGKLIFITGGIKSGKSRFAEQTAAETDRRVLYIATALAGDREMEAKINLHRERRPDNWVTVEEPLNIKKVLREYGDSFDVILLDCLTMLITNHLFRQPEQKSEDQPAREQNHPNEGTCHEIIREIEQTAIEAKNVKADVIVVSNEVGLALVADNALGRKFQELVGTANSMFAKAADTVYLVVSGYPLTVKEAL